VLLSTANLKMIGSNSHQLTPKFYPKYIGPFTVKRVINNNAYELELPPSLEIHPVINISRLRPYRDGSILFPHRPRPISRPSAELTDDGTPAYEVEEIIAKRGTGPRTQYLVRWLGYPMYECTWESMKNLKDASQAVHDFENGIRHN
jgi:hypothetical protein